jgi:hypothetical protein
MGIFVFQPRFYRLYECHSVARSARPLVSDTSSEIVSINISQVITLRNSCVWDSINTWVLFAPSLDFSCCALKLRSALAELLGPWQLIFLHFSSEIMIFCTRFRIFLSLISVCLNEWMMITFAFVVFVTCLKHASVCFPAINVLISVYMSDEFISLSSRTMLVVKIYSTSFCWGWRSFKSSVSLITLA